MGERPVEVEPIEFECADCSTIYICNRVVPDCVEEHPGQYHLQEMLIADPPCQDCASWVAPLSWYLAEDTSEDATLLFPPKGTKATNG